MRSTTSPLVHGVAPALVAMVLALTACGRAEEPPRPKVADTATVTRPSTGVADTAPSARAAPDSSSTGLVGSTGVPKDIGTTSGTTTPSDVGAVNDKPPGAIARSTDALSADDKSFVEHAIQGGLFEVQFGKMVADRASEPQLRAYGQMLIDDHTNADLKLRQIATARGLALPATLSEAKKESLEKLGSLSADRFDREAVTMAIEDHKQDIAAFDAEAKQGDTADLQSFAKSTLPVLEKHLDAAERLRTQLKHGG